MSEFQGSMVITKITMEKEQMNILDNNKKSSSYGQTKEWQMGKAIELYTLLNPDLVKDLIEIIKNNPSKFESYVYQEKSKSLHSSI